MAPERRTTEGSRSGRAGEEAELRQVRALPPVQRGCAQTFCTPAVAPSTCHTRRGVDEAGLLRHASALGRLGARPPEEGGHRTPLLLWTMDFGDLEQLARLDPAIVEAAPLWLPPGRGVLFGVAHPRPSLCAGRPPAVADDGPVAFRRGHERRPHERSAAPAPEGTSQRGLEDVGTLPRQLSAVPQLPSRSADALRGRSRWPSVAPPAARMSLCRGRHAWRCTWLGPRPRATGRGRRHPLGRPRCRWTRSAAPVGSPRAE